MVITSKAVARSHLARTLCRHPCGGLADVRTALFHARSCTAPALDSLEVVVERRHSDHLDSVHVVAVGSRPSVGHDELAEDRIDLRAGRRSSLVVAECGDDSHHDAGCNHEEGRDGRSSHLLLEVGRHHRSRDRHDSHLESGNDSARVGVGRRFEAETCKSSGFDIVQ